MQKPVYMAASLLYNLMVTFDQQVYGLYFQFSMKWHRFAFVLEIIFRSTENKIDQNLRYNYPPSEV